MPAEARDEFRIDLGLVKEAERAGVTSAYTKKKDTHWEVWLNFCEKVRIDPHLTAIVDPVPYLQVFGARYCDGHIAPSRRGVKSATVSDAIRSVGQRFSGTRAVDQCLNLFGKIDFRLARQLRSYTKSDPPKIRVKPIPVCIVLSALEFAAGDAHGSPTLLAIANLMCIAFYFCLRPGEYTGTTTDDQAFSLNNVNLFVGGRRLSLKDSSDADILASTRVHLTFDKQKNMEEGTVLAHARSDHPTCCPVVATIRQVMMHREAFRRFNRPFNGAVKLASYYTTDGKCLPAQG